MAGFLSILCFVQRENTQKCKGRGASTSSICPALMFCGITTISFLPSGKCTTIRRPGAPPTIAYTSGKHDSKLASVKENLTHFPPHTRLPLYHHSSCNKIIHSWHRRQSRMTQCSGVQYWESGTTRLVDVEFVSTKETRMPFWVLTMHDARRHTEFVRLKFALSLCFCTARCSEGRRLNRRF